MEDISETFKKSSDNLPDTAKRINCDFFFCIACQIPPSFASLSKNPEMERRECPMCGKEIAGRSDKLFCSDRCRNRYHNGKRDSVRRCRMETMKAIDDNYRFLDLMVRLGKSSVALEEAIRSGFSPGFMTGTGRTEKRHRTLLCFDISYCLSASKLFNVKRIQSLDISLSSARYAISTRDFDTNPR